MADLPRSKGRLFHQDFLGWSDQAGAMASLTAPPRTVTLRALDL
jgi:hypothetical protein